MNVREHFMLGEKIDIIYSSFFDSYFVTNVCVREHFILGEKIDTIFSF